MRNILPLALMAGVLAGCAGSPQSPEEYAATVNADRRVWPPYAPESACPPQIMDGESQSGARSNSRDSGRDGGGRGGGGGRR